MKKRNGFDLIRYFAKNIIVVISLVMIWRGIWYVLDFIDLHVFQNQHIFTAVGGIILGLTLLYVPDKDSKEIEKL